MHPQTHTSLRKRYQKAVERQWQWAPGQLLLLLGMEW